MAEVGAANFEQFILSEVAELTGEAAVSPGDSFLQLGGDSLKAILLASAIEERYDVAIDLLDVFQSESLRALSLLVAEAVARRTSPKAD
ncbi:MAG: acyl carrier protein [Pseudonocardiaceae bacterium]